MTQTVTAPESPRCASCLHPELSHDLPRHREGGTLSYTGCHDCVGAGRYECSAYVPPAPSAKGEGT